MAFPNSSKPAALLLDIFRPASSLKLSLTGLIFILIGLNVSFGQSSSISSYAILAGDPSCQNSTNCGVIINNNCAIDKGYIGSYHRLTLKDGNNHGGSLYARNQLIMYSDNTIGQNVWVGNTQGLTSDILEADNNNSFSGDIIANGNIDINSGSVVGSVLYPVGSNYSGPVPGGGEIQGNPSINPLPAYPPINVFPPAGTADITNSQTISPGSFDLLRLNGSKVLTFSGPGDYVFERINNFGFYNTFIFDFQNSQGDIRILVHDDVNLGQMKIIFQNGGDPSRIYLETHDATNGRAFRISGGSIGNGEYSTWCGTVWAPYESILVGDKKGKAIIKGSLFSGIKVQLDDDAEIEHVPFGSCDPSNLNVQIAIPDSLSCTDSLVTISSSANSGTPSWSTSNGNIVSGAQSFNPVVNDPGIYILTVTDNGCTSTDTIEVYFNSCIVPYYPAPEGGKTVSPTGSELTSLSENSNYRDSLELIYLIRNDSVFIEVIALAGQVQTLKALLATPAYGMTRIIDNGPNSLVIPGLLPIANLPKLDSLPNLINYVRPLFPAIFGSGLIESQGDLAMKGHIARGGFDVYGEGVKVGVLSNSFNTQPGNPAQTDVLNGDLPGVGNPDDSIPVHIVKEYPFGIASDEGRAMLQIVHDVAPKAELAFRTGFLSAGDFANGILELVADSCDVIVDDITYITEPFLSDGLVAQSVNQAKAQGVTYISSAGNFGSKSYGATFNPAPAPGDLTGYAHDFGGGDIYQSINLAAGNYLIVLQWQDSIYSIGQTSGTNYDLDLFLTDDAGNTLFGFNRVNTGGDPVEIMAFTAKEAAPSNILIVSDANVNVPFKLIVFRGNLTFNEHQTGTSTIAGHPNAEGAIAVGAAFFGNTPAYGVDPAILETFSSTGGTPVGTDIRNKPDLCGPDGGNTSVFLGAPNIDGDPFPNFFGTSAAAPHVAGVAALIKSAQFKYEGVNASPDFIKTTLTSTAADMGTPGFDFESGYGFVRADEALLSFSNPTPALYQLQLQDTTLDPGIDSLVVLLEGDYFTTDVAILLRNDTVPTSLVNSSTIQATIPPFTGNPAITACLGPKSSSGLDGGCSDTLLFFAPTKMDVQVIVHNQTKKYSQDIPELTFDVLVDDTPYDSAGYTLADLGLDTLNVYTVANNFSNVGIYLIRAEEPNWDPTDPNDAGLLELYNYEFIDGALTIEQMPLIIAANDTTIVFGEKLGGFSFSYEYPDSLVASSDSILAFDSIQVNHLGNITNAVAVVEEEAQGVYKASGRSLVNAEEVEKLTYMASGRSLVNAGELRTDEQEYRASGRSLVNNHPDTSWVIYVSAESIFAYRDSPDTANLSPPNTFANSKLLVNALSVVSGRSLVNGVEVAEEEAQTYKASGRSLVNTYPLVNGEPAEKDSSEVVLIFDEDDVDTTSTDTNALTFSPIVLVTGYNVGSHYIVPPPLVNQNYSITYQLGTLIVLPDTITLKADSVSTEYGDSVAYGYTTSGYEYQDSDSSEIEGPPTYSFLDSAMNPVTNPNLPAGGYYIVPDNLNLKDTTNYVVIYENGWLDVTKANLNITARDTSRSVNQANPTFVLDYNGFKYADGPGDITPPTATSAANNASPAGTYPIVLSGGSSDNYALTLNNGTLTVIEPPTIIVKADDKGILAGSWLPNFTYELSGDFDPSDVTGPPTFNVSPNYYGSEGTYDIIPSNLGLKNGAEYQIIYENGTLYVNPYGWGADNIQVDFVCVDTVLNDPSGLYLVATFEYYNSNSTPVYIPIGPDNILYQTTYLGTQPEVFHPGSGTFDVLFDGSYGKRIKWKVRSYWWYFRVTSKAVAKAHYRKCWNTNQNKSSTRDENSIEEDDQQIQVKDIASVYPNPTSGDVYVLPIDANAEELTIHVYESTGRLMNQQVNIVPEAGTVKVQLGNLSAGIYILRVESPNGTDFFRVSKY